MQCQTSRVFKLVVFVTDSQEVVICLTREHVSRSAKIESSQIRPTHVRERYGSTVGIEFFHRQDPVRSHVSSDIYQMSFAVLLEREDASHTIAHMQPLFRAVF